jgi:hypothetical protein
MLAPAGKLRSQGGVLVRNSTGFRVRSNEIDARDEGRDGICFSAKEGRGTMRERVLDVRKDEHGNLILEIPRSMQLDFDEEFRTSGQRGVSVPAAVLLLQSRLSRLEEIPRVAEVACAGGKGSAGQAPKAIKRLGRADLCRFGFRPDPHNDKRLVPDKQEQETIRRAQLLRSFGLSFREVCRKLDCEGRDRRGKKWEGSHSVLAGILRRAG